MRKVLSNFAEWLFIALLFPFYFSGFIIVKLTCLMRVPAYLLMLNFPKAKDNFKIAFKIFRK